jgi:hypothetical protein
MDPTFGGLISPPAAYNFDDTHPGITLQVYLNDQLNDCVIAARAHHNLRLAYVAGMPVISISDPEVSNEYHREAPFGLGILLGKSLGLWRDRGWQAGGSLRSIDDFTGPLSIVGAGMAAGDATSDLDLTQLKSCIIEHDGVQADLNLPQWITVNDAKTFGPDFLWQDTTKPCASSNRHVMLLTGYDGNGPIGITWGAKQHMTWAFLQKYYTGLYWVQKGSST